MRLIAGDLTVDAPAEILDSLDAVADDTGTTVQAFDARYIVGERHLERALELADRAIAREHAIADDRAVEILLFAAGRRQIDRSLDVGLKPEAHPVIVLVDGGDEAGAVDAIEPLFEHRRPADGRDADPEAIRRFFDIGEAELATGVDLESLVLERVALLTVNR